MLNGYESKLATAYGMTHPVAVSPITSGGAATERVLALDDITQRVHAGNNELAHITQSLRERLDSLIGPTPRAASGGNEVSELPTTGRVQGLHRATLTTAEYLGILAAEVARLSDL